MSTPWRRRQWSDLATSQEKSSQVVPTPPPQKGELVLKINREDIRQPKHNNQKAAKISGCRYVASYNWLDQTDPTVVIPGRPPAWTPPNMNRRLDPDSDQDKYFRDPNAARYPPYPLEAAVRAVLRQNPDFATTDIDIVTCASTLGNLGRFARGVDKDFRFIMARIGPTVFLVRRENSPTELIPNVRGYGHTFPEEYTTWERDVGKSVSHQRVISYRFGGLSLLVRFEVDGYRREGQPAKKGLSDNNNSSSSSSNAEASIDSIDFASASISNATPSDHKRGITIKAGGTPVAQDRIFDLKTRSVFDHRTRQIKKEIDLSDIIPRLWASQIPTLIVAFHNRGHFKLEDIEIRDMREEIKDWEEENGESLGRLVSLLHQLVGISMLSRTSLEICRTGAGPVEVRELAGEPVKALPSELRQRWRQPSTS